jgi:small subunit ribosomal protein S6
MSFYECTILLRPELSKAQIEEAQKELVSVLTAAGGTTSRHEYWGLRALAYPINKLSRAHYIFFNASVDGKAIIELERQMRIREDVMRYLSVRVKELNEEPSPMVQQPKARDEKSKSDDVDAVA